MRRTTKTELVSFPQYICVQQKAFSSAGLTYLPLSYLHDVERYCKIGRPDLHTSSFLVGPWCATHRPVSTVWITFSSNFTIIIQAMRYTWFGTTPVLTTVSDPDADTVWACSWRLFSGHDSSASAARCRQDEMGTWLGQ